MFHWSKDFLDQSNGDEFEKRLYDKLSENYNKLVKPIRKSQDTIGVQVDLKLLRLIEIVIICILTLNYFAIFKRFNLYYQYDVDY